MNLALIENFRTMTISTFIEELDTKPNYFDRDINIEFVPDEIVLKTVSVYDSDTTTAVADKTKLFAIKSNLIYENANILFTFPLAENAFHEAYHVPFRNINNINGTYRFTLISADIDKNPKGEVPLGGANFKMYISFTLLFIKYRK